MKNILWKVMKTSLEIYIYKNISISNVLRYKEQQQRPVNLSRKAVLGATYQTNRRAWEAGLSQKQGKTGAIKTLFRNVISSLGGHREASRSLTLPAPLNALFLTLGHDVTTSRFSIPSKTSNEPDLDHVTLTCLPEDGEGKCYISFGFQNGKKDGTSQIKNRIYLLGNPIILN